MCAHSDHNTVLCGCVVLRLPSPYLKLSPSVSWRPDVTLPFASEPFSPLSPRNSQLPSLLSDVLLSGFAPPTGSGIPTFDPTEKEKKTLSSGSSIVFKDALAEAEEQKLAEQREANTQREQREQAVNNVESADAFALSGLLSVAQVQAQPYALFCAVFVLFVSFVVVVGLCSL